LTKKCAQVFDLVVASCRWPVQWASNGRHSWRHSRRHHFWHLLQTYEISDYAHHLFAMDRLQKTLNARVGW